MYGTIQKISIKEYEKLIEGNKVKLMKHFIFPNGAFKKITFKNKSAYYIFITPEDSMHRYLFTEGAFEYVKLTKQVQRQLFQYEIENWLCEFRMMEEGDYCFVT